MIGVTINNPNRLVNTLLQKIFGKNGKKLEKF
jgi:hypothetical protein